MINKHTTCPEPYGFQIVPVVVGLGVVVVSAVFAKIFWFDKKKKAAPVTLQNPNEKYKLKLVDKVVSFALNICVGNLFTVSYFNSQLLCGMI